MAKAGNPGMTPEQAQEALYALMASRNTDIEDIKRHIQQLRQEGANINSTHHNPLIRAISFNNINAVKALIGMGADPRVHTDYNTTLDAAFMVSNPEIIEVLVTAGADINVALYSAAARSQCVGILNRLIELGANPNIINPKIGLAPLHIASQNGNLKAVRVLLKHGADPNARDVYDQTPFDLVGTGDRLTIARILVMNGADVHRFPATLSITNIVELLRARQAYVVIEVEAPGILHAAGILPHAMPAHLLRAALTDEDQKDNQALEAMQNFYAQNPQYLPGNFLQTISELGGLEALFDHPGANPVQLQTALHTLLLEVDARMPIIAFLAPGTTVGQLDALRARIDQLTEAKLTELGNLSDQIAAKCPSIGGVLDEVHAPIFTTLNLLSDPQLSSLDAILSLIDPTDRASLLRNHTDKVVNTLSKLSQEQVGEFTRLVPQLKAIERKDLVLALVKSENPQAFIVHLKAAAQSPQKLSALKDVLSLVEPTTRPVLLKDHAAEFVSTLSKLSEHDIRTFAASVSGLEADKRQAKVVELIQSHNPLAFVRTQREQAAKSSSHAQVARHKTLRSGGSTSLGNR